MRASPQQPRAELVERLRARRGEIEGTLLTRTYTIADPAEAADPEYAEGLRAAVSAALEYGLTAVERGKGVPPVPVLLLAQARLAARNGVGLDTVLRRYFAGYTLLSDFLVNEAREQGLLDSEALRHVLRDQAALFDRLLAAVSEEHRREAEERIATSEQRRTACVERLLAGELVDTGELAYDLEAWHLGLVACGPDASEKVRLLAASMDARLLLVRREHETAWGWLGSRRRVDPGDLRGLANRQLLGNVSLAIGEPESGLSGWRLTHRQAQAALAIALHGSPSVARYGEVALLAAVLQDDFHAAALHRMFIAPIESERDRGAGCFETLRAYFAAGRNAASAAAALGISRQAVSSRLRTIEKRLGRSVDSCIAELEVALKARDLEGESRK